VRENIPSLTDYLDLSEYAAAVVTIGIGLQAGYPGCLVWLLWTGPLLVLCIFFLTAPFILSIGLCSFRWLWRVFSFTLRIMTCAARLLCCRTRADVDKDTDVEKESAQHFFMGDEDDGESPPAPVQTALEQDYVLLDSSAAAGPDQAAPVDVEVIATVDMKSLGLDDPAVAHTEFDSAPVLTADEAFEPAAEPCAEGPESPASSLFLEDCCRTAQNTVLDVKLDSGDGSITPPASLAQGVPLFSAPSVQVPSRVDHIEAIAARMETATMQSASMTAGMEVLVRNLEDRTTASVDIDVRLEQIQAAVLAIARKVDAPVADFAPA
jgi:hypothetical protein